MKSIFSLRRLRWKLAFSYTLVTVVALLALEVLVLVAGMAFLNSPALPFLAGRDLGRFVAPQMRPDLAESPPDVEGLEEELRTFTRPDGSLDLNLTPSDGYLLVVDEEGRLIAASRQPEGVSRGESFDAEGFPGLDPLVDAALGGREDPWRMSDHSPDGRQMYAVAPVREEGRVIGALVATFRLPNLNTPLLVIALVGAGLLTVPAAVLGLIFGFFTAWGLTRRLRRLALAAQAWSRGDFSVVARDRSKDELGQLSRELNDMAAQLENLLQTRGELATLDALNRFAGDLHDSVKQQVFATSLQIAAARALIERDTAAAEDHLSQADELVRQAQKELNILISEMRPAALEGKGLASALREYVARWSQGAEIPADLRVQGERETPLEVEQALFRVAQEALANVARHSGAEHAEVDLIYTASTVTLRVADDGRGFDPAQSPGGGFGLQSMRERLVRLGGHINVESAPGKGTRVTCVCPLN